MVFRKGPKGLGYYIDTPPKPSAAVAALARGGGAASGGGAPATQKTKSGLELKDVRAGRGNAAKSGDRVSVKYRGTLTNGKQFDAGSIDFRLGRGEVIRGYAAQISARRRRDGTAQFCRAILRSHIRLPRVQVGRGRRRHARRRLSPAALPSGTGVRQARRAANDPAKRDAAL